MDRCGEIWEGFILKMLMDLKNEAMINHLKEGDYIRNIWQEYMCHLVNNEFLDLLFQI